MSNSIEHDLIVRLDPSIMGFAKKYNGRAGAEYDDLVQEGRIAALLYFRSYPTLPDWKYISRANARMIDWLRYCKRGHDMLSYDEEFGSESDDLQ